MDGGISAIVTGWCDDWTSASIEDVGGSTGVEWPTLGKYGEHNCNQFHFPLLCVQQAWYAEAPEPG